MTGKSSAKQNQKVFNLQNGGKLGQVEVDAVADLIGADGIVNVPILESPTFETQ